MTPQQAYRLLQSELTDLQKFALDVIYADAERFAYLERTRAKVEYTQRRGEKTPHCELHGAAWCRRDTMREAVDKLMATDEERPND